MKYSSTLAALLFIPLSISAQQKISPDTIAERLLMQTTLFPQENIYTQTDRSDYVVGDTVWFRTYLVNAISRKPEMMSQYVYAELIHEQADTVICRAKARKDTLNMIYGYLPIPPTLSKGTYCLRTYTHYGSNWDEEGIYSKSLRIYSTLKEKTSNTQRKTTDYQIDFLPEGGYAIDKQLCRFALKAQNSAGHGEEIQGVVVDAKGDTLTRFSSLHNGMGEFSFIPLADQKYHARCTDSHGEKRSFVLPQAVRNSGTLKVTSNAKQCYVTLVHDSLFATDSLQLVVLQRGHPCFASRWQSANNMVFSKQSFDTGIVHFLLLSSNGKILSERLAFIDHSDYDPFKLITDQTPFSPRKLVTVSLELTDSLSHFREGNCSVSVTDSADVPVDRTTHILSTLLLTADLNGQIETPGWYFETPNSKEREKALDLLMMTHGWRRYDLQAAINGRYTSPSQLPEVSMKLSGEVKTPFRQPIDKSNVQIYALGTPLIKSVKTNEKGKFRLDGFELPDSTKYIVTALSAKKKSNVILQMDKERFPAINSDRHSLLSSSLSRPGSSSVDEEKYIQKVIQNLGYSNGMRHYLLGEVEIDAKSQKVYQTNYERDADITIKEDRIKQSPGLLNIDILLRSVAGFYIYSSRGGGEGRRNKPIFILDEMPIYDEVQFEQLAHSFDVSNIQQIDLIKGPRAAGYLDGKYFCIIAITTKRGGAEYNTKYVDTNMTLWIPLGYQQPAEMYAPRYDQPSVHSDKPDLRTTIYWKPNLTIKEGKASFSFYTADTPSTYQMVIEGVSTDGKVFRKEGKFF